MIDHSDSTNGKSSKYYQDKLKADPGACLYCIESVRLVNDTWTTLEEMKAGYEEALELSGQNCLELERDLSDLKLENHQLRTELRRLRATN